MFQSKRIHSGRRARPQKESNKNAHCLLNAVLCNNANDHDGGGAQWHTSLKISRTSNWKNSFFTPPCQQSDTLEQSAHQEMQKDMASGASIMAVVQSMRIRG
jgi:hypothetical protein